MIVVYSDVNLESYKECPVKIVRWKDFLQDSNKSPSIVL